VLYFYVERGGNQYGPRFHYEAFLFMAVFVAANLLSSPTLMGRPRRDRVLVGLMAASVAAMPVYFAVHAVIEQRVIRERMAIYHRETKPLSDTYRERGLLVEVDGMGAVDEVTGRILAALT